MNDFIPETDKLSYEWMLLVKLPIIVVMNI